MNKLNKEVTIINGIDEEIDLDQLNRVPQLKKDIYTEFGEVEGQYRQVTEKDEVPSLAGHKKDLDGKITYNMEDLNDICGRLLIRGDRIEAREQDFTVVGTQLYAVTRKFGGPHIQTVFVAEKRSAEKIITSNSPEVHLG